MSENWCLQLRRTTHVQICEHLAFKSILIVANFWQDLFSLENYRWTKLRRLYTWQLLQLLVIKYYDTIKLIFNSQYAIIEAAFVIAKSSKRDPTESFL